MSGHMRLTLTLFQARLVEAHAEGRAIVLDDGPEREAWKRIEREAGRAIAWRAAKDTPGKGPSDEDS